MSVKNQSRCGLHCINLDVDEGSCNAIMYNRESKVMFYKTKIKPMLGGEKKDPQKVCLMGEGRLVGFPTEDTGLRVAWSR